MTPLLGMAEHVVVQIPIVIGSTLSAYLNKYKYKNILTKKSLNLGSASKHGNLLLSCCLLLLGYHLIQTHFLLEFSIDCALSFSTGNTAYYLLDINISKNRISSRKPHSGIL